MFRHLRPMLCSLCLATMLLAAHAAAAENPANPLVTDRGLFRPLIIVAPSAADPDFRRMRERLATRQAAFDQREMLLYTIAGDYGERAGKPMTDAEVSALLEAMDVDTQGPTTVILVGKDGGKKMQLEGFVPPQQVFDIIDRMPMRRRESGQRS
ncbi:DUF4174 domain-containing protein [Halomonas sp. HP20-15]|uniref:DUF4174 domain-containing protein n=1 Tax=Halomonas sp. HP20-15 TaxID=3085901 RepID=UPI0029816618|nr:DUF4174 domain-containing protein [Halomonas sp. HP20-15]MDW5378325.1 DUF4174 domain-containing protein [Halomonas sp. HP20-15]